MDIANVPRLKAVQAFARIADRIESPRTELRLISSTAVAGGRSLTAKGIATAWEIPLVADGFGRALSQELAGEEADMVDEARPYAIHSDSECDRLEKQAVLAGLENHLRHVPVPKTARILDAGCGSGAMARCFASHFADASVIGVDIRDDYVVYAQSRAKENGLQNVEFRQGSVFDLPFADASFDVVWSKYVMQWIDDPEKAVAEFRRVTKPGGVVVCCNFDGFAVTHYPEDKTLQRHILTVFPRLVDVNIGRKTAPIFHMCGLINISVYFEPDSLFTTVGTIDPQRRENWVVQLAAARPHIAKILASDGAASEFCDAFVRYYDRPDTSSYTALYFVRGQVPATGQLDALPRLL